LKQVFRGRRIADDDDVKEVAHDSPQSTNKMFFDGSRKPVCRWQHEDCRKQEWKRSKQ